MAEATRHSLATVTRAPLARLLALVVAIAVGLVSAPAIAAPTSTAPPSASASEASEPASVEQLVERGDLTGAREAAEQQRKDNPTPEAWHTEAQVLEQMGEYDAAATAYRAELKALPKDAAKARSTAASDLARVNELSRGRIADEPASTHRAELDKAWASGAKKPRAKRSSKAAEPGAVKKDRIVKKWYFWVTIAAIAASAAAVTAISIKAARDERGDVLDTAGRSVGATLLRF